MRTKLSKNEGLLRRKIRLIEVNAKYRSSKKIDLKRDFLRPVYIRVYRLNSVMLVFSTQVCDLYSPL